MELKVIHYKIILTILLLIILGMFVFYELLSKPSNSVELYTWLNQEENTNKLDESVMQVVDPNTTIEDLREQILDGSPSYVKQYTLLEYIGSQNSLLIETTPGTRELEVLHIYQLTDEVETYFKGIK